MIKTKPSRKDSLKFSNFGFSTILLSFVMICVVSFSALSLLSSYSDYKLSKKVALKTEKYYEAKQSAYDKLEDLDAILCDAYMASSDEPSYLLNITKLLDGSDIFTLEGTTVSFEELISEDQSLQIQVSICYPTKSQDTFYEILKWRSEYATVEFEDEYLDLIQ